jgi:hypothetical protein
VRSLLCAHPSGPAETPEAAQLPPAPYIFTFECVTFNKMGTLWIKIKNTRRIGKKICEHESQEICEISLLKKSAKSETAHSLLPSPTLMARFLFVCKKSKHLAKICFHNKQRENYTNLRVLTVKENQAVHLPPSLAPRETLMHRNPTRCRWIGKAYPVKASHLGIASNTEQRMHFMELRQATSVPLFYYSLLLDVLHINAA